MELKTENNLPFPQDINFQIYTYLTPEALWLWSLTSKAANKEYSIFLNASYANTNKIVYDFIDAKLSNLESAYYYNPKTCEFFRVKQITKDAIGEAILSKEWVKKNLAFQKFAHDIYSKSQNDELSLSNPSSHNRQKTICLSLNSGKFLSYIMYNGISKLTNGVIVLEPTLETSSNPITLDMLKPYEEKIRHELGLKELNLFLEGFENVIKKGPSGNGLNWNKNTPANEVPYLQLFNDPLFQTYYLNQYITFDFLCEYIATHNGAGSWLADNIMRYCLHLKEYSLDKRSFISSQGNENLLSLIKKNPKSFGYFYSNQEIESLKIPGVYELIDKGYATFEQCLQHSGKLIRKWNYIIKLHIDFPHEISKENSTLIEYICKDMTEEDRKNLNFLEFFCEGLADNPQRVLKGAAILELYQYIDQRTMEEKNSPIPIMFKNPFAYSCKDKIKATLALIYVLFEIKDKSLSERDVKILTYGEDRLTTIVKNEVLKPLQLNSLEKLNPKTIEFDLFV